MPAREQWIAGARLAGAGEVALCVRDGRIAAIEPRAPTHAPSVELGGQWITPFALDAHTHLVFAAGAGASDALAPELEARFSRLAQEMLRGGVAGALDLGAPRALLGHLGAFSPLEVAFAGPLLCAPGGYPTQSWGRDGFGLAVESPEQARAVVAELGASGATFVKLSLDRRFPLLEPQVASALVEAAHARKLRCAAHALDAVAVRRALDAGVDILAHTPLEQLPEALVLEAGKKRLTVLSTLHAFGVLPEARDNLARLAAAGCAVLYGSDLGNTDTAPGLLEPELRALAECGLTNAQILWSCTEGAAELLCARSLGRIAVGMQAHLLVTDQDPLRDPAVLCHPTQRLVGGVPLADSR